VESKLPAASMTPYLLCCALGVFTVGVLPELPSDSMKLWIDCVVLCLLCFKFTRLPGVYGMGLCWGLLVCQALVDKQIPRSWENRSVLLRGEIVDLPRVNVGVQRFAFKVECAMLDDPDTRPENCLATEHDYRILLSLYSDEPGIRPGETWLFKVRLKRPHGLVNASTFNYEAWLFSQGFSGTGYIQSDNRNQKLKDQGTRRPIQQIRYRWREFVNENLRYSLYKGLLVALLVGDSNSIEPSHWEILSLTGTNHLLIISGLHVSLVIGLAFNILKTTGRLLLPEFRTRNIAILLAIVLTIAYAQIAGFGLPVQRALVMAIVVFASLLWKRVTRTRDVMLIAMLAVSISDPMAPFSTGFWLSFSAVMVLLFIFSGRYHMTTTPLQLFRNALFAQWSVYIGLFALTGYLLMQVSLVAPVANIIAIPFISLLVVPCSLLAVITWQLAEEPGKYLLHLSDKLVELLWQYLEVLAQQEFVWIPLIPVQLNAALGVLAGFLLLVPGGLPGRWLSLFLALPSVFPQLTKLNTHELQLSVLDVGQGLSVLIQTRNHSLIYDMGSSRDGRFDLGSRIVVPEIRNRGILALDKAVISNGDNDHAGGARSVLEQIPTFSIVSGDPQRVLPMIQTDRNVFNCEKGDGWVWDGVVFEMLHPDNYESWAGNNQSCVLSIKTGSFSALIPGDIDDDVEHRLIASIDENVDLLVVPHHGSASSSSPAFLNRLHPSYAVVSAGYLNRFGHPHHLVLERYRNRSIGLYNTSADGAVDIRVSASGEMKITHQRELNRRFWYEK
jgi:competence protein ComEC